MTTNKQTMPKDTLAIHFSATIEKVQTLVDGGIRVTFDLPEDAIAQAAQLMACKAQGIALKLEAKADGDA